MPGMNTTYTVGGEKFVKKHVAYTLNGTNCAENYTIYGTIVEINNLLGTNISLKNIIGGNNFVKNIL